MVTGSGNPLLYTSIHISRYRYIQGNFDSRRLAHLPDRLHKHAPVKAANTTFNDLIIQQSLTFFEA